MRCGFNVGYFDKSDVAQWADRWILALEEPCDELFDLSMNRSMAPIDLAILLRNMGSSEPTFLVATSIGFVGLMYGEKRFSTQHAAKELYSLAHQEGITPEEASRITYLDDGCDLAYSGLYGSIEQIKRELSQFVSPYAERLISQFPQLFPSRN